jgi:hypothetical protein
LMGRLVICSRSNWSAPVAERPLSLNVRQTRA